MPISFGKIKKIEIKNYLINILLIVVLFGAIYLLRNRFLKEVLVESPMMVRKVRVDFNSLEKQKSFLEKLFPYNEIPEIKEIKTSFSVSGSFTAFKNFIFALERSARMVKIENISFRSGTKTEKTPTETFDFSFGVKIYSF